MYEVSLGWVLTVLDHKEVSRHGVEGPNSTSTRPKGRKNPVVLPVEERNNGTLFFIRPLVFYDPGDASRCTGVRKYV